MGYSKEVISSVLNESWAQNRSLNPLEIFFIENQDLIIHKWLHYFDIYDRHFNQFRNKKVKVLEIGVFKGGSLRLWRNYFGSQCEIFAIDIDPECKKYESEGIKIFIGSQADKVFLERVKNEIGPVDIIIDDGSHVMEHVITSLECLYELVKTDGVYLIEDLHTAYWKNYGGGYQNPRNFYEYIKNKIDFLNASYAQMPDHDYAQSLGSMHFYDSIAVLEKKKKILPFSLKTGKDINQNEELAKILDWYLRQNKLENFKTLLKENPSALRPRHLYRLIHLLSQHTYATTLYPLISYEHLDLDELLIFTSITAHGDQHYGQETWERIKKMRQSKLPWFLARLRLIYKRTALIERVKAKFIAL